MRLGRFHKAVGRALGMVVLAAAVAGDAPAQTATGSTTYVNFSFDQADLRLLAKLVGDMTGRRFIIDNAVSGKITVVTPPQIPVSEVYPLFLSILESSGFSVVEEDQAYRIVPLPERAVASAPVVTPGEAAGRGGVITKVIKVEHISVAELKKALDPMIRGGKAGALTAFGPTNHLIVTDTAENIARLEKVIGELDRPGGARVVEVVKLEHASADELAGQLNLAMRGAESADRALGRRLQQITEGVGTLPTDVVVVPSAGANSLVLVGTPMQLGEMKRIIQKMDVETQAGYGRLNAIFLKYLSADEASKSLNALLAKTVDKDQRQKIAIEPNISNNALVIDASPQDFALVKSLIDKLDQVPQQVLVEILIAEVTGDKNVDVGVEWSTVETPTADKTTIIGRSRPEDTDQIKSLVTESVFPQGLTFGVAKGTYVDSSGVVQPKIPILVKALSQNRDVKILSNVPLWAQNNTDASVSVVQNIPVLKSTIEGGSGTARDVIQNLDRTDVGIKLKVTPHVNPDREILMQLNPSIEAVVDEGPPDKFSPTIAKREVSTTITVPDQATVVISGLIREDKIKTVNKVPLLGDIPILGWFFRSTQVKNQKTNLLIFVTPHIVTDMKMAAEMKERLQSQASMTVTPTNIGARSSSGK